jgi:hypothetical protein
LILTGERGYDREIKQNIQTQYQNSEISRQEFVNLVAHRIQPVINLYIWPSGFREDEIVKS